MRKIFVCSPLRGDLEGNQRRAVGYARQVALLGMLPIVPHIYFTQFLREEIEDERAVGIEMGIRLLEECDEMWVWGEVTEGMQKEISHWEARFPHRPPPLYQERADGRQ